MLDSRLAWVSVGASRTDLEAASSASLLHSIYGSQASQLPFSDHESETSLPATQSEFIPRPPPAAQRRYLSRPKSSPAATLLAREQQKRAAGRPGSAVPAPGQRLRPATARSVVRPGSAAPRGRQRPGSAHPSVGGAAQRRTRPRTALGVSHHRGSMVLVDVEEEEEEGGRVTTGVLRDTSAPVQLTRVPEYFNFWNMKPIQRREFGVPQHKRRVWNRPKSDYGNRLFGRRRKGEGEGGGGRGGVDGEGRLGTLLEGDGVDSDQRGARSGWTGGSEGGDGGDKQSGMDGGKDGDGNELNTQGYGKGGGRDSLSDKHGKSSGSQLDSSKGKDRESWRDRWSRNKGAWGDEDGSENAKDERYFKEKALASTSWMDSRPTSHRTTRFELPMDMRTLEAMTPLQYLRKHTIISDRRLAHCSHIFTKLDRDRDSKLNKQEVLLGLVEVHYHCITEGQASSTLELVGFPLDLLVDLKMFAAISCVTERMFQLNFLPIARREVIEVVDFEALDWKLRECTISTPLRTLFSRL